MTLVAMFCNSVVMGMGFGLGICMFEWARPRLKDAFRLPRWRTDK